MTENEISGIVADAAIEVHRQLGGPGLLQDMYEEALCHELSLRGLKVQRQHGFRVHYKGKELDKRLRIDVIVEGLVIVEVKAVDECHPTPLTLFMRRFEVGGHGGFALRWPV